MEFYVYSHSYTKTHIPMSHTHDFLLQSTSYAEVTMKFNSSVYDNKVVGSNHMYHRTLLSVH